MYCSLSQQEHVISELKEYTAATPPPPFAANVRLTIQYLEACNQLFERGILAHVRIWSGDSTILQNMEKGYNFFCSWLDSLLEEGTVMQFIVVYVVRYVLILTQGTTQLTAMENNFWPGRHGTYCESCGMGSRVFVPASLPGTLDSMCHQYD